MFDHDQLIMTVIVIMTMITMIIAMQVDLGDHQATCSHTKERWQQKNIMSLLTTIYDKNDDRIYHLVVKVWS